MATKWLRYASGMTDATVPDRIEREVVLDVPVERVWAALTDPAEIVKWFGDGADVDLRPGGDVEFRFGSEKCPAIVEVVEPMRRFAYWWQPGSGAGEPVPADNRTLVDFTLEPAGDGTRLRLVESGFASVKDPARQFRENDGGWDEELGELVAYLSA